MAAKSGPRGEVSALDANGQPVIIRVFWKRGSTYLSHNGVEHLVHPSNLRRQNGFAMEATLAYSATNAVYRAF